MTKLFKLFKAYERLIKPKGNEEQQKLIKNVALAFDAAKLSSFNQEDFLNHVKEFEANKLWPWIVDKTTPKKPKSKTKSEGNVEHQNALTEDDLFDVYTALYMLNYRKILR